MILVFQAAAKMADFLRGGTEMSERLRQIRATLAEFSRDESGQDLIEYALLAALIALAAVVGMNTVASDINNAFVTIGSRLSNAVGT